MQSRNVKFGCSAGPETTWNDQFLGFALVPTPISIVAAAAAATFKPRERGVSEARKRRERNGEKIEKRQRGERKGEERGVGERRERDSVTTKIGYLENLISFYILFFFTPNLVKFIYRN